MSEIKRINTRAELEQQKREHPSSAWVTQDKQIPTSGWRHWLCG